MKSIKVKRKESLLKEIIPEALSQMNDSRIRNLNVVDVVCSRDGSDAKVYLEKGFLTKKEQNASIKQLKQAKRYIENYCLKATGWFKVPKLQFTFDELLERENKMEELFAKIAKEKKDE